MFLLFSTSHPGIEHRVNSRDSQASQRFCQFLSTPSIFCADI
jgi:hypothetical protein